MDAMKQLADELVTAMRERLPDVLGPGGSGIRAVCVCGSYARGDFMGGSSDLDFNVLIEDDTDATLIQRSFS